LVSLKAFCQIAYNCGIIKNGEFGRLFREVTIAYVKTQTAAPRRSYGETKYSNGNKY
jgi:hypothetical protein